MSLESLWCRTRLYFRLPPSLRLPQAINFLNQSPKQRAIIFYFHLFAECVCLCLHIHLLMRQCGQVCMCTVTFAEETNWSTGQMPPSKGWLFLASALLTHIQYTACLNRTETKCVPAYGRSGYKAVQIFFFGEVTGLNQKLNFNTVACEDFASGAWFPPFYNEAVLDSPAEAVMFKQPPSSACFA